MSADLTLSTVRRDGCALISIGGEVDLGTASELSDEAFSAMQDIGPRVVLDLTNVSFMDSTGLKVLLAVRRSAQLAGGLLALAAPTHPVQRVINVTGLQETFTICPTVEQAVLAVHSQASAPDAQAVVAE